MAGLIVSAGIVSGQLILGLDDGSIVNAGVVQGPQGLQGPQGPMGATGRPGTDGNTVHSSNGRPRPDLGRDGDFCIDRVNWEIFYKEGGVWGKGQPLLMGGQLGGLDQGGKQLRGAPRFFPIGGASSGVVPTGPTGGGLDQILNYGAALPTINTPMLVAIDDTGDAMLVDIWARSATGTSFVEMAAAKGTGTDSGHSTVFDVKLGANPPTISFSTAVIPGPNPGDPPQLQVFMSSNQPLLEVRGKLVKL